MIIATMASLSTREKLLARTVASLLPQVDALCVYLNGYDRVPACLVHPKVAHAVLGKDAGWRGAEAKLWFWDRDEFKAAPRWSPVDIALTVDDDIIYPPDYVARLVAALKERPGSIACVHGSILMDPFVSYLDSRWIAPARGPLSVDTRVHVPGTGTMAWRVGDFDVSLRRDVTWSHCVDVMAACAAKRQRLEVWSVARPDGWLHPLKLPTGTGIFRQRTGARQVEVETATLKAAGSWEPLAPTLGFIVRGAPAAKAPARIASNPNSMLPPQVADWIGRAMQGRTGVVVEIGSGHGSARLAASLPPGCRLMSIEHDARFVGLLGTTEYVHAPIVGGWYDWSIVDARLPPSEQIAAVIVDGPPATIGRAGLLPHLARFGTGPIIVDDVHRSDDLALAHRIAASRGVVAKIHKVRHARRHRAFATIAPAPA